MIILKLQITKKKPRKACFCVILKHFCSTSCSCIEKKIEKTGKKMITEANFLTILRIGANFKNLNFI